MKKFPLKIILFFIISHTISRNAYAQISLADSLLKTQENSVSTNSETDSTTKTQSFIHPYKIRVGLTIGISAIGTIGDYFAIPRILGKDKITDEELAALNPNVLTRFDRWGLMQDPAKRVFFDKMSDNVITGIFILPVTLAFNKNIRHDGLKLLLMYYESQAITFSIFNYSFLGPTFQNKFRPMTYYTSIPVGDRNIGNNRNSFFAGHVSSATAATFFMAKVYCDYHPELGAKKILFYAAATVPALAMGYLRLRALKHFPSDILTGMSIGAICGIAIPSLHRLQNKNVTVGAFASPKGATGLSMNWNMHKNSSEQKQLNKLTLAKI